jgi:hypothetical protein
LTERFNNHLQHFDERMDAWDESSVDRGYVDNFYGPRNMLMNEDGSPRHGMRHYVPSEAVYIFMGEEFAINPMIVEARKILASAEAFVKSGWQ